MATHVKFVHDFVTSVKKAIQLQNIGNGDAITNYALGTEGYRDGVEAETAKTGLNLFEDAVSSTITGVLGCEEYKSMGLLDSQRKAAILVGKLCASPSIALQNLDKLRDPVLLSGERMIGAEEYGVDDAIDPADVMANLGIESYDGQKLQNAIYYSIAYNLGAARQDAFGEAFFPTITIDPTVSGFTIELEFASLIPEFLRERNGNPDNPKFNRIPVIKSIYDHSIHTTDKNKCIPVFENSENADVLIADLKHVDTSTTREITTAPIKFGKTVSLLGLSQDDYLLSTGVMDMTDSLDRTVTLDKIYYSLNKDAEETFAADMSIYPHNGFIANPLEHHKDVILNFNAGRVVIPVSTIKNAKGTASEQWKKVVEQIKTTEDITGWTAIVAIKINGRGNTQSSDFELFGNAFELESVTNAAGVKVDSNSDGYKAIKTMIDSFKFLGYDLEAYRTNSNLRTRGQIVTTDKYRQTYNVPFRSGVTSISPVTSPTGNDNDSAKLAYQIQLAGIKASRYAVATLDQWSSKLALAESNGSLKNLSLQTIARDFVTPYYSEQTLDLFNILNNIESNKKQQDIRAALLTYIETEAMRMYIESGYGPAFDTLRGNVGGKITLLIGTDPNIYRLLVTDVDRFPLSNMFDIQIVSTLDPLIKGKIYMTFGIFDETRNTTPNPLNFGNMLWSPTISYEIVTKTNGANNSECHNNPRFLHIVHLPILTRFNVINIDAAFKKIPTLQGNYDTVNPLTK